MKYAIVDIGSNTVRLNLYLVDEENIIKPLLDKKRVAGLSSYVNDGQMTRKGSDKLVRITKSYLDICRSFEIDEVHMFATAALRNATNSKQVIDCVENQIGHKIEVLTGEDRPGCN